MEENNSKLELEYPLQWVYKVIGTDREQMGVAISSVFTSVKYTLRDSRLSKTGKYLSLEVELEIASEADKNRYYQDLSTNECIKMVL